MQRTKRAVSLLLSVLLVFSCFTCLASLTAAAADGDTPGSTGFLYGDVDGDGVVKINDATAIQRHLAEQEGHILTPGTDAFKAADVNGDGNITVDDVTLVQQYLAEFIDKFPVEEMTPTEAPTEAPVTEAPATEAPATEAPATEAPATEAPATEEPVVEDTLIVAGSEAEIFGTGWDGTNEANLMTKQDNGTYTKEYTVDKAYTAVQLKSVKNGAEWIGDETGNNVTFNLTGAGTFTVVYNPETNITTVEGDIVEFITEFTYDTVYAAGNGEGMWLNGAAWDPAYVANEMTEVAENIWEIEFTDVPDGFERQIKFAIDGTWTHNFGGAFEESGVVTAAAYNGDNITFDTDDTCTVKAQLDLSNFDFSTKEGATFTITITYEEEPTEEPVTEAPATEAPVTEAPTEAPATEAPATEAPATEAPATEAPATEAPATEAPATEEPVVEDTLIVAGSEAEIFGTGWDGTNEANLMTKQDNGTYTKEYTVDKAYTAVQLKSVKNGAEWIGDETGNNVTFNLTGAGTFTVVYNPETNITTVEGDIVEFITEFTYDTVYAAGNGEGMWLNGAAWDPAYVANEMTEVAENIWEIEFTNVPDGFERQIKFAIDGAWTHNFGGAFEESGVVTAAAYNGDNITFDTDDTCTVKAQLDLSNFDFSTKEGATFTITITYEEEPTEEPATEAPATEAPVTEAPATEAPATEAPATEAPATEAPATEEPVVEDTLIVAGSEAEIFGTGWDGTNEANLMTKQADGTYTKEYTVDKAYTAVQLKSVKNGAEWIGDETGNNVTFNLTGAGTFTVVYNPETNITTVEGDIVEFITEFTYDTVYAAGNGEGMWLNGAAWDPAYVANEMTEVAENIWEIEFTDVPDGFERQIKFAIDGAWTHNFGGAFEESGVVTAAAYNGDNITFDTDDTCTVKAQLDLSNFDFSTKEGATFTITITYEEEPTEEPATEAPSTEAPATEAPATEAPVTEAPATEAPATEAPATEAPATEAPATEEPVVEDTLIVAGSEAEIFGTGWDGTNEANLMTKQADGTYTKEYTVDKAYTAVQLKSVKNGAEWIGDETGNNVTFNLTGAGTFTVVYNPETNITTVEGDIVEFITDFEYDTVFAVGNGEGMWLNGAAWDPAYVANEMTEVAENIWEIEFTNVPDGFERQIKFAIDGAWTHNFGGAFEDSGVVTAAAYNGDNITFDTDDICTVKAQLDLSNFDFSTKEGATFTITITYEEEPTEEPATEAPSTEAPATEAPATEAPATEAPATEAPATEAPATEAPATEAPATEEPVVEDTLIVAGSEAEIFGTGWDGTNEANLMTKQADGTYTKEYTVDKAYTAVQLKSVKNGAEWIGDETGNNVTFNLTGAGTFTVVYNPETNITTVEGDIVEFITDFEYDTVFAVGNGEGMWLNGASWDPAYVGNEMTEVAEGIWEIEFTNVPDGFERQIKFAIDGAWTHNFGGAFEESGVVTAAAYNGDNITFDTDDTCTVKAQLDLSNFDFSTKEGATFTITITYEEEPTEEPATEAPSTEAPATEAPATEAPVTEAPATEAPATEAPTEAPATEAPATEEPVVEDTLIVAGSEAEIFGTGWDGTNEANLMTKQADGTYTKEYTVDKAYTAVQLKSVKNGAEWIGDETGNNVTFNLTGAGTFTVVYNPETNITTVEGDIVEFITDFEYDTVFAVGNGEGMWLNGAAWDPAYVANEMTEVAENIWEIEFTDVPDGFERQIKFAIDGAWTHNFGGAFEDSGVVTAAAYNGDNITFDTDDICTVKAQLDLSNFDFSTKEGATFTITITYEEEPTEEPATEAPSTEAPATEAPATEAPATEAPATEAPATEAPATEAPATEEPVVEDTLIVAGSEAEIFGTGWDGTNEANLMTKQADGTYTKEYTVDKAYTAVQLKSVKNGAEWIGDETGNNVTFNLTGAGTFTVVYNPETNITTVEGDIVEFITEFTYDTVYAAGNGEGMWLNGAAWDPAYVANEMEEVAEDVWEIEFTSVPDGFERQIKFAIDGAWTHNFGGAYDETLAGEWQDAVYNGDNITFDTDDTCTVTVQLDLSNFDFSTKEGAKYKLEIEYAE